MHTVLKHLLTGTRGGRTRIRLLRALAEAPQGATDLAAALDLEPETVRHHLTVLRDNNIVTEVSGGCYHLTERTVQHREAIEELAVALER